MREREREQRERERVQVTNHFQLVGDGGVSVLELLGQVGLLGQQIESLLVRVEHGQAKIAGVSSTTISGKNTEFINVEL